MSLPPRLLTQPQELLVQEVTPSSLCISDPLHLLDVPRLKLNILSHTDILEQWLIRIPILCQFVSPKPKPYGNNNFSWFRGNLFISCGVDPFPFVFYLMKLHDLPFFQNSLSLSAPPSLPSISISLSLYKLSVYSVEITQGTVV